MMAGSIAGSGDESLELGDELALNDDDSLPWLESEDYDDDGGVDTSRIIGFAAILLVILALVIGAVWYLTNRTGDDALVADGSTIAAPEGPYKERPDEAGGKQFAGTGDTSFAVGEGQTTESVIKDAEPDAVARPTLSTRTTDDKPVAQDGVGVQVGAYGSRALAETGWATLRNKTVLLNGVRHRVLKGQADIGTVYRLQAVSGDLASARSLCEALKGEGIACQVKRP
ncbi:MAG: SPOR domain-containing protein [Erythrobacter sp.]